MSIKRILCLLAVLLQIATQAQTWTTREFSFTTSYDIQCDSGCTSLRLLALVPRTQPGTQEIYKTTFSIQPHNLYNVNQTCFVEFLIPNPEPKFTISILTEGRLYNNDYETAHDTTILPPDSVAAYLVSTQLCEVDSPRIRQLAAQIMEKHKSAIQRIHDIWNIAHPIKYVYGPPQSALEILETQAGCCTGKTSLFIALCRACGIPARRRIGVAAKEAHSWPEAYIEGRGWVKFEPTHFNEEQYQQIQGWHILLSNGRFTYHGLDTEFRYHYWWQGAKASVEENFNCIFWTETDD